MNPLWHNIFRKKPEEDSLAYFLGQVAIFADLNPRDLSYLEKLVHIRAYSPKEVVFEEGDPGSGMYLIRSGSIQIFSRTDNASIDELAVLGTGDFFGETTLTAPAARSASARTLEKTALVGLFRADLLATAEKHPGLANRIMFGLTKVVSERLQAASHEIRRLESHLPPGNRSETVEA